MIEYKKSPRPEFTVIKASSGNYYHQMGNYCLIYENQMLIPVNRSYVINHDGNRSCKYEKEIYRKKNLIHEKVSRDDLVVTPEQLVKVYGKPYLCIAGNQHPYFSSTNHKDERVSVYAKEVLDLSQSALSREMIDYTLGIFGSHRVGLGSIDSDIDLVMWTDFVAREVAINLVREELRNHGYKTSEEQGKNVEYAARYARRFGISNLAGWYLAKKRNRFIDSRGISISLQCLNKNFDHGVTQNFFEAINKEWSHKEVDTECEVVGVEASYNFPKYWKLDMGSEILPAISLSWMHQGMGDDNGSYGNRYRLKASLIRTENEKFIYLRDSSHFIIPQSLL